MDTPEIIRLLREAAPGLRQDFGVTSLSLFGSVARGEQKPGSDVDVMVEFDPERSVTLFTFAKIQRRLEGLLGRTVDVVENHDMLPPSFRRYVERERLRVA